MGLLDQFTQAVDARKRYYGNIVRGLLDNPQALMEQLRAQNAENVTERARSAQETQSVMPGIAEPAQRAAFDEAMNMGLLGITAYHGSPRTITELRVDVPKTTGGSLNKYGVFLSPDEKTAARYAKDFGGNHGKVYKVDADVKKTLGLSSQEFNSLQRFVGMIDNGRPLNEIQQISLEDILTKHGIRAGEHPINAIKQAGFDSISADAGRYGAAERELLVFDPKKTKILSSK